MERKTVEAIATSVRTLTIDAVQKAGCGHPGMPMGSAELGAVLYGQIMRYEPSDPSWINRDRLVLSAGHGSLLLYTMLHMAGFDVSIEDIKRFRTLGSKCPGHPEVGVTPGVEATTGPLGQGVAMGVGMALAETMAAATYNTDDCTIFDYHTYVIAGDGCLEEGISSEASSFAGHYRLGKLIVYYDNNHISIDGSTDLTFTEDVGARYEAYGWQVLRGDMYDPDEIIRLTEEAKADKDRPSLIMLRSVLGKGAPNKQNTSAIHGSPLGEEERALFRRAHGITEDFYVLPEAYRYFKEYRTVLRSTYDIWQKTFAKWQKDHPESARELSVCMKAKRTGKYEPVRFEKGSRIATRAASKTVLQRIAQAYGNLVGGSADLMGPNSVGLDGYPAYSPADRKGRYIHFGIREFSMAAICNGLALSSFFRPFCATFLVFSDYLRPALRLSALMKLPVVYVFTHDSFLIGEDGPTHQPIEHLASLRAIPNMRVLRPADAEETGAAWEMAMERIDGPTAIVLSRQNESTVVEKEDKDWERTIRTGAYSIRRGGDRPDLVIVTTGAELDMAIETADSLSGRNVRIVSMISRELFESQGESVRQAILPPDVPVMSIEAGSGLGWERITHDPRNILCVDHFCASAPGGVLAENIGFTVNRAKAIARSAIGECK